MGKTLLESLTNTDPNETTATVTTSDEHKALSELMQDMKLQLENASNDLLQPRKEALDNLLKKVLH